MHWLQSRHANTPMKTLFISDLHLDASRPEITGAFDRFMRDMASQAQTLYILGDFFEVWIGDDDTNPFNTSIIEQLKHYTDNGGQLFVMVGNRDFLMGDVFASQTGATLLPDPTVIDLYGTPTLLMHGDSMCTNDEPYMAFRLQARSTQWQQGLLSKPIDVRREIAREMREQSKSMNSLKAEDIMDVTASEVTKMMSQHQVKRLIHGHTHRPERHPVTLDGQVGERIVLGDWHDNMWWLEATPNGELTLRQQAITTT